MAQSRAPGLPYSGRKPFYGWVIVFVGFVSQFIQGLITQGFSTYGDLLFAQFGWSRAAIAGPRSVTSVQGSVLGPVAGFLIDRFGARFVVGGGVVITGVGLILFGTMHSLWMYYVSNIVMALGLSLGGMMVVSVAVSHWFRRRSTIAQAVMLLGFPLAGAIGIPALVFMQGEVGWRVAAVVTGIAIIVVGVPCSALLRTRPEPYGLLPDGDAPGATDQSAARRADSEHDFTLAEAVRTRAFWLLAFAWAACMLGTGVVQVHLFLDLGEGVGIERDLVSLIWSIASLTSMPSRLIGGFLGDRLPKNVTLGISIVLMGVGVFALAVATSFGSALLFAVPYGIGWGISTPVINAMQGEYFGHKSQGLIRGWLQMVGLPFMISAPVLVGYIADRQGTYQWAFTGIALAIMAGAIVGFLATRPKIAQQA